MFIRSIKAASLATAALFTAGCAVTSNAPTYGLDDHSAALVRQTCNDIMGLRVGPEFDACGGSLADTMRYIHDATLTAQADAACEKQGLSQGTPDLAKCVVLYRRANVPALASVSMPAAETSAWTPYFSMSDSQKMERAELSCAQLGLHPSWSSFNYCVADLRHSILNIRDSSMP